MGFALLALSLVSFPVDAAEQGNADVVRDGAWRMVGLARVMVEQGTKGQFVGLVETAQHAIAEGNRAIAAVPPSGHQHERDTIEELTEAIKEAQRAMAFAEQGQQEQAVTHAKSVLSHARRGASHAEAL